MIVANRSPIRVAQVVSGMNPAGLETWLMSVLRNIDRKRYQFDFITHVDQPCFFDDEIRSLGAQVIYCPGARTPFYSRALTRLLNANGPYDVVHSHLHHYSGWVLRAAKSAGVPMRIAHSHSDTSAQQRQAGWVRRTYLRTTENWVERHATHGLAVSDLAGAALFRSWRADPRWRVFYCGIELERFRGAIDRHEVRTRLGIPSDAFVMGHVGMFRRPKNHGFLLQVAKAVLDREPQAWLLLVGDGELRAQIERRAHELGIAERVVFTGTRPDAPELVRGAADVFVFPSLWEGLPLSVLEAQSAGLPCVISDLITPEIDVVDGLVERLSLLAPVGKWAATVLAWKDKPAAAASAAIETVERSPFNIKTSVKHLEALYAGQAVESMESCDGHR